MIAHGLTDLKASAGALPDAWRSHVLARVGPANFKVVRMDASPFAEEHHDHDEVLLVVDGVMELVVAGEPVTVRGGAVYVVPAGVRHRVAPGSQGTLVIVDL